MLPLFIFDPHILDPLPPDDHRVDFIYRSLQNLDQQLREQGSGLLIFRGSPAQVFDRLLSDPPEQVQVRGRIRSLYLGDDYEPYARKRNREVEEVCHRHAVSFHPITDQVIFSPQEVLKDNGQPYTVFTPYKKRWLAALTPEPIRLREQGGGKFLPHSPPFPTREELGLRPSPLRPPPMRWEHVLEYQRRDFPGGGSYAGLYLRFGTIGIRELVGRALESPAYLSELIWREFFKQILYHFPEVVRENFNRRYDRLRWRNRPEEFARWCRGETGYPLVDAGMRELNATGFLSNRVRMTAAGFLCKHLLIDWRWGEKYFAEKLFDYELSSNNGNWQWCAGTGCDAAPYFRVFNPELQAQKFDPDQTYVQRWVPELGSPDYLPMVAHKEARERALEVYREAVGKGE